MKLTFVFPLIVLIASASAFAAPGFFHNSKPVLSYESGKALFDAMKSANETDESLDVCYEGDFNEAIAATEEKAKGAITFTLIDVYGEDEFPSLDLEVSNDKNEAAYGIVPSCN